MKHYFGLEASKAEFRSVFNSFQQLEGFPFQLQVAGMCLSKVTHLSGLHCQSYASQVPVVYFIKTCSSR